jgi:very-short-patch-repair endonuclease
MTKSALELDFMFQIKSMKLSMPETEYLFHSVRKWRFDYAWPDRKIAVEIEGGIWTGGSHTRGVRFIQDCEKYNTATAMGWKIFRLASNQIKDGSAIEFMENILEG